MMEAHTEPVSQGSELYPHSDSKWVWEGCTQGLGRLSCVPQIIQVDTPPIPLPPISVRRRKELTNTFGGDGPS